MGAIFWWSLIIAGLILVFVKPVIFASAVTVGTILLVVAGAMFLWSLVAGYFARRAVKKFSRRHNLF